jgi:cytochrome P460
MRVIIKWSLLASAIVGAPLFWGAFIRAESPEHVPYPDGYRRWTRVESGLNSPGSPDSKNTGGIHHTYANDIAMAAMKENQERAAMKENQERRFPEGSIIVRDLLEVQTKEGITTEGGRRHVTVMHKDSKRFADTGGWGFEVFRKDSHTDRAIWPNAKTKCFDCHAGQKEKDYVFGSFRK